MTRSIAIPAVLCVLSIMAFLYMSQTLTTVWLFIPAIIISFLIYLNTYYKREIYPDKIVPYYLLALGIQFLHFAEEYATDFTTEVPQLLGGEPYPLDTFVYFNMVAYFIFLLGGIALFKRIRILSVIAIFFIIVGTVLNPIVHISAAIFTVGYFPGFFTSLLLLPLGFKLIRILFEF